MDMSKSEFAAHIGVSAARITQYLQAGIIGPDALIGEGRHARINVEAAKAQIARRRHPGQALGNGLLTRLGPPGERAQAVGPAAAQSAGDGDLDLGGALKQDPAHLIQLERLEQERRKNRTGAIEEARALGRLVDAESFRREIGKTAQTLVSTFMGMAPDIANALAAKFGLSQRDVLFEVRRVMNDKRASAATALRLAADELPESEETEVETA